MAEAVGGGVISETGNILLVSAHDWFASALQAVLEPEGFVFARVRSARVALRDAELIDPDVVIVGEDLPDMEASALANALRAGPLKPSIPILVYSPNFWHESAQAAAMTAGAWDILKEPVRSRFVLAKLRRLLEIKQLIEASEEGTLTDTATGLFNLAGLMRMMGILEATAKRREAPLTCAILGPTTPASGGELHRQRADAAAICRENVRGSDVCGVVGDADVGIVAYGTTAAGMTTLLRRLSGAVSAHERTRTLGSLSAGVVELQVPHPESGRDTSGDLAPEPRMDSAARFAAARNALRQARQNGGGIRIAEGA